MRGRRSASSKSSSRARRAMGDSRIQIRYVGKLASDIAGCDGIGSGTGSCTDDDGIPSSSTTSKSMAPALILTPSADAALREVADSILRELVGRPTGPPSLAGGEGGTCIDASSKSVLLSFGSGDDAIVLDLSTSRSATDTTRTATLSATHRKRKCLLLYDTTLHPSRNVTPMLLTKSHHAGINSTTLQSMGWYPSASLAVCYADDDDAVQNLVKGGARSMEVERDEGEYNRPGGGNAGADDVDGKNSGAPAMMVRLTGEIFGGDGTGNHSNGMNAMGDGFRLKPSQIMASVADREVGGNGGGRGGGGVTDASDTSKGTDDAHTERLRKASDRRKREVRRTARLDEAIQRIDEADAKRKSGNGGRNAKVSAQVKKMLIKSRAVGSKSLREEDRFYVEVIYVDDDGDSACAANDDGNGGKCQSSDASSYRYFSRLATAGQVASTSIPRPLGSDRTVELLVKPNTASCGGGDGEYMYRRLPALIPLHQAEEKGYIRQFDRIVVRAYNVNDDATPSIVVDENTKIQECEEPVRALFNGAVGAKDSGMVEVATMDEESNAQTSTTLSEKISEAIEAIESASSSTKGKHVKKKKKSATSDKVRKMLMKSKAIGDKKGIRDADRFYLEVVVVNESVTGEVIAPSPPSPYFFNRMASLETILGKVGVASDTNATDAHVKIQAKGMSEEVYLELPDHTVRLCDAEKAGKLQQFCCVVVIVQLR